MHYRTKIASLAVLAAGASLVLPAMPAQASTPLKIVKVYYDSPGTDTRTNTSLNGEYVVIKNITTSTRSITGWTLRDVQNHIYKFGTLSIGAGKTVTVHTGKGTNSSSQRYWGLSNYVWNNDTDKAYLRNASGTLMFTCAYNSTAVDYKNC